MIDAVAQLNLGAFDRAHRQNGHGRAAFEPAMMVALLLHAYARGLGSSRAIERACEEDVAFRVLAAHQVPDHTTIATARCGGEALPARARGSTWLFAAGGEPVMPSRPGPQITRSSRVALDQ